MTEQSPEENQTVSFLTELANLGWTDCHSRYNTQAGKGYLFSDSAVSPQTVAAHYSKKQPIAVYLFKGSSTQLAVLDIDNHGGELKWDDVVAKVLPLAAELKSHNLSPFVVKSGGGSGIHIWLLWHEAQPTDGVRHFLARVLKKYGFKNGTRGIASGEIEIYPKQNKIEGRKKGNPIALPFSRLSEPLDENLQPLSLEGYTPPEIEELFSPGLEDIPSDDLPHLETRRTNSHATPPALDQVLTGDDVETQTALQYIPAEDYDAWIRIGFILKTSFGDSGYVLWDEWSKSSAKYPGADETRKEWEELEPDGSLTIGTLFYLAQQAGWNGPSDPEIREMNSKYGIITQGTRTMVVEKQLPDDEDNPLVWITKEVLRDRYKWKKVAVPRGENIEQKPVADYWLSSRRADHYRRIDFNPDLPPGNKTDTYNIWTGFAVQPEQGDWDLMRDHIVHNICDGDEELVAWLLNWMALGVQQPSKPIGTVPVLAGQPGVGKGVLAHAYGSLWGRHYATITHQSHVSGRFNAHLLGRRFIFVDEGMWGGNRQDAGNIKTRITEPYIMVEAKGVDPVRVKNRTIWMIGSNEASIVPADLADRRWQILDVGDRNRDDKVYFGALVKQLDSGGREAMLHDLLGRDISQGPDPRGTIKTSGLFTQILRAQGPEFRYLFQILDDGALPQGDAPGNGPGVTTIKALYEDMRATQHGAQFVHTGDFGRQINRLFPGIKKVLSGAFINRHAGQALRERSTRYYFPPLAICRRHFERYVGQSVPWSSDLEDWQSGSTTIDDDPEPPF